MRFTLLLIVFVFTTLSVSSQQTDPKVVLETFFDAYHSRDSIRLKQLFSADAEMYRVSNNRSGEPTRKSTNISRFITAVSSRPLSPVWEERLGEPKVHKDQNLAVIWVPFKFYLDEKLLLCGVNMFTLFWNGNSWLITELSDTNYKDCNNK